MIENILKLTEELIISNSSEDIKKIFSVLKFSNISEEEHKIFCEIILQKACINLHFHPDRISGNTLEVIDSLIESGEYKNQYQTFTSSGSLTAKLGGDRDIWENKLFNNFYGANINDRPKYGSLNLTCTIDGASPRFGSCFFITSPEIKERTTFTYGDSHLLPKEIGTIKKFTQIFSQLYSDIFFRNRALGFDYDSLNDFIKKTTNSLSSNFLEKRNSHNLDFYIEAQIHGDINLKRDITFLVADRSFKDSEYEARFRKLCEKHKIQLFWNSGYELKEHKIPNNFRGTETKIFAEKIAENGVINAYIIGKALKNEKIRKEYNDLELHQLTKYVWHCLVKFGT